MIVRVPRDLAGCSFQLVYSDDSLIVSLELLGATRMFLKIICGANNNHHWIILRGLCDTVCLHGVSCTIQCQTLQAGRFSQLVLVFIHS